MRINKTKVQLAMMKSGINDQKTLAERSGLNPNTVSLLLRGAAIKPQTLAKLAYILSVEPESILMEDAQ